MLKERTLLVAGIGLAAALNAGSATAQMGSPVNAEGRSGAALATGAAQQPEITPGSLPTIRKGAEASPVEIDWHGWFQLEVAKANFSHTALPTSENVNDMRGRFVFGPDVTHWLSPNYYLRASGRLVAWVREIQNFYQINLEDAYGQVGRKGLWDIKAGRFRTLRINEPGLGFVDFFTLENDIGVLRTGSNLSNPSVYFRYRVDDMYLQQQAGRFAFNLYPSKEYRLELAAAYGDDADGTIVLGGRAAAVVDLPYVTLKAGAESRSRTKSEVQRVTRNGIEFSDCAECSGQSLQGFGGTAIVKYSPIEVGFHGATQRVKQKVAKDAPGVDPNAPADDPALSYKTSTFGGYAELDVGDLLWKHSLKLGYGLQRSQRLYDAPSGEQDGLYLRLTEQAYYIAYPLGFNNALVKFVFYKGRGYEQKDPGPTQTAIAQTDDTWSARLHLSVYF